MSGRALAPTDPPGAKASRLIAQGRCPKGCFAKPPSRLAPQGFLIMEFAFPDIPFGGIYNENPDGEHST